MSLASRSVKKLTQRVWTRLMDRVGGRLVSGMADTSADAPNSFHKPKRDVYRKMKAGEDVGSEEAEVSAGHDHDHDHS
ncbi:MAG: hypothetical protein P8R54_18785 [Myxococcota bacterium]|nr:hypothetical protein [Myxococcota bacterium]